MKKKNIFLLFLLLFLSSTLTAGEEDLQEDGKIRCSDQVLKERETRRAGNITITRSEKITVGSTLLMVVLLAVAACFVSLGFGKFQDLIYKRPVTLDSTFDAGGENSSGLITVSTMCDRTTMATLLGSSSMVLQYGVSGSYWYAIGGGIHLIVFAFLSVTFKTKAPGAKTILQFIRARFGTEAHLLYMVYCLFCNFVVFSGLLVDATQAIDLLVQDLMPEFSSMLLALLIGGYTIVGGLGGTFYVSYLNSMVLFTLIIVLQIVVYLNPSGDQSNPLGNITRMYELVDCWEQRSVFTNSSYMSFGAPNEWKFGFNNFFYFFGFIIIDQSNWQGSVASKPASGAVGFITGGLCWMAISMGLATTSGMAFVALSSAQGYPILSDEDINAGLVFPTVAQNLLGTSGTYLMLALILLAVMSTGSGQVIAIASIIIYDIYMPYIQPFKKDPKENHCLLCDKPFDTKKNDAFKGDICDCGSMRRCGECRSDDQVRAIAEKDGQLNLPHYTCSTHKDFRVYQDKLLKFANWCVVITTIVTVPIIWPLTSLANNLDLDLITIFKLFVIPVNSGWVPLSLAIIWSGATSLGIIAGCVSGLIMGVLIWLIAASSDVDGLTLASSTSSDTLLAGNIAAMLVSGLVAIIVSKVKDGGEKLGWKKTLAINNPLTPWIANYEKELKVQEGLRYCDLPDPSHVIETYKRWSYFSIGLPLGLVVIFMLILPLSITSKHFALSDFTGWMSFCNTWTILAALWVVLCPALQQIYEVYIQMNKQAKVASSSPIPIQSISSLSGMMETLDTPAETPPPPWQ